MDNLLPLVGDLILEVETELWENTAWGALTLVRGIDKVTLWDLLYVVETYGETYT